MYSGQGDEFHTSRHTARRPDSTMTRSRPDAQSVRTEDSWIEINSQLSNSTLHPASNADIITTGLNVTRENTQRRSLLASQHPAQHPDRPTSVASSSQDEYDESESESDQVMSSSNEEHGSKARGRDEDDARTALGTRGNVHEMFTPQPNAFSHPPQSNSTQSVPAPSSHFSLQTPQTTYSDRLPSNRMLTQQTIMPRQSSREHFLTTRSQTDHDAALRASLTTLLSCAAAVRPKDQSRAPIVEQSVQPRMLRLVPGSQLTAPPNRTAKAMSKHKSRETSKDRQTKKARVARSQVCGDDLTSPTLTMWMLSAGVVLIFSAISFSAGYAWARDAARVDGELTCATCGREAARSVGGSGGGGLRRLRWSSAAQSVRA